MSGNSRSSPIEHFSRSAFEKSNVRGGAVMKAVKYILKDRERRKSSDFRTFKLQKLNFEASSYLELLGKDFENVPADLITETPLTLDFSNADLEK